MTSSETVAADPAIGGHRGLDSGRAKAIVAALAITQTVGYGTLYYAFAVFLVPPAADLKTSTTAVTGPSPRRCSPRPPSLFRSVDGSTVTVAGR